MDWKIQSLCKETCHLIRFRKLCCVVAFLSTSWAYCSTFNSEMPFKNCLFVREKEKGRKRKVGKKGRRRRSMRKNWGFLCYVLPYMPVVMEGVWRELHSGLSCVQHKSNRWSHPTTSSQVFLEGNQYNSN